MKAHIMQTETKVGFHRVDDDLNFINESENALHRVDDDHFMQPKTKTGLHQVDDDLNLINEGVK